MKYGSFYAPYSCIDSQISYICANEYPYFLNKTNVVGVALGYKLKNGFYTNEKCINVFVTKKISTDKLNNTELIPPIYKGIKTNVIESGIFTTRSLTNKVRPVIPGYSIGIVNPEKGTETLGCLVTDGHNNYFLSNNHVLANGNIAPLNSKTIQPGPAAGGKLDTDVVGHLAKFIPIKYINPPSKPENYVDCAISKVLDKSMATSSIALIGPPKGTAKAKLNEHIQAVGKVTELTKGIVNNINGTFEILFLDSGSFALFKNQITATCITASGDSGSVLLNDTNMVVGLFSSGNRNFSIFNPIDSVLKSLGVSIVKK